MDHHRRAENKGFLYAVMLSVGFCMILLLIAGGIFLFQTKGDFYSALKGELNRAFLIPALFLFLFSSILYTPLSFGISYYFLLVQEGAARFSSIFILFQKPRLMLKAILLSFYRKLFIYIEGLALLLLAAILEVALFFLFLLVTGTNLFEVSGNPFHLAADFMLRSPLLIFLSIILWIGVLLGFLLIRVRYLFCKYILLCYKDASSWQAIKGGRMAIQGHLRQTLFVYLRSVAFYLLAMLPFGARHGHRGESDRFSAYALMRAKEGWRKYCSRRSLRKYEHL